MDHPFQIIRVNVRELPLTTKGSKYLIVFQDFFTKWSMALTTPDQKTQQIARLVAEEIISLFGVPEALLSDGSQSTVYLDAGCLQAPRNKKLNTTANILYNLVHCYSDF